MHLQPPRMEKLNMELETRGFTVYMAARAGQHRIQEPYFYLKISGKEFIYGIFYFCDHNLTDTGGSPWCGSCSMGRHQPVRGLRE